MAEWEFMDTVYSEREVKKIKENLERSGYQVQVKSDKTPSEIPCWRILVRKAKK